VIGPNTKAAQPRSQSLRSAPLSASVFHVLLLVQTILGKSPQAKGSLLDKPDPSRKARFYSRERIDLVIVLFTIYILVLSLHLVPSRFVLHGRSRQGLASHPNLYCSLAGPGASSASTPARTHHWLPRVPKAFPFRVFLVIVASSESTSSVIAHLLWWSPLGLCPVYPLVDALGNRHELVFPLCFFPRAAASA
jgi:hypothetical protein